MFTRPTSCPSSRAWKGEPTGAGWGKRGNFVPEGTVWGIIFVRRKGRILTWLKRNQKVIYLFYRSEEKNELRVKDRNRNHERSVCPGQCFTIRDHFKINMMKLKKKKCHLGPKQTPKWRLLTFWNTLSIFGALRVVLLTVKVKLDLAKRQTAKLLKDEDQVTAMVYAWNFSHSKEGSRRVVSSRPA